MANKEKKIIPNNLLKIRQELGYSQKELAAILNVSERMICNYETNESNLPPDKAILLSQKWNYSLDWIYCNKTSNSDKINIKNYSEEESFNFLVDIRDFLSCYQDKVKLSVSDTYWEYIKEVSKIKQSSQTSQEKKRKTSELNGLYKKNNNENITWEFSIDIEDFTSMIHFGNSSIPFVTCEPNSSDIENKEKIKEIKDFFHSLTLPSQE